MSELSKLIPEVPRQGIQLPPWHYRYLLLWAYAKGQSRAGLIANITAARIEANRSEIERMIAELAELNGLTSDELKAMIWAEAGLSTGDD